MKRIALFCDGTWNTAEAAHPTNVVRLSRLLRPVAPDGVAQRSFYLAGVGTGANLSGLDRLFDRLAGGAVGWGLDETIMGAYRALAGAYEPGDAIHVFGFSRGAYTARSLVGLIRSVGIAPPGHLHRLPEAMERYRTRGDERTKPSSPLSYPFRAEFSPLTATSADELDWRRAHGKGSRDAIRLRVAFLGVWDTVGSLGVPAHWATAPLFNERFRFHDHDLSSMVLSARHAVALDERRRTFLPTLWTNVDRLNREALGVAPGTDLSGRCREGLPYRQEWFPGDHGGIGGGERVGLSAYARGWIAEGAEKAGLSFVEGTLDAIRGERNAMEALVLNPSSPLQWGARDRDGPETALDVAFPVFDRRRLDPAYRPRSLGRVWEALAARDRTDDVCGAVHDGPTCRENRARRFDWVTPAPPAP